MLHELFRFCQQLLDMVGMVCLLWGTFCMIGAMWANRNPIDYVKGTALLIFGVYVVGLARNFTP